MSDTPSLTERLRANAPLYVVIGLLLLAFIGLAGWGSGQHPSLHSSESTPVAAASTQTVTGAPPLDALPANADDEAVAWSQLGMDAARLKNASVPLVSAGVLSVPPFTFRGTMADRERATNCLTLAALAEAGSGDADQRAVMQVILNRVRHPAFSNTVCGVVFEGSERATGCQFSFTCDGSLSRSYAESQKRSARQRAQEALGGYVYQPVGNATHYHADYVYPWWSPKLHKIAVLGPHIFYRWQGFWGTPKALNAAYRGNEPDPFALRSVAEAVERPAMTQTTFLDSGETALTITANQPELTVSAQPNAGTAINGPSSPAPGVHFVLISKTDDPAALIDRARGLCPGDRYCQVYGWTDAGAIPSKLPLSNEARRSLSFSFLPARQGNGEAIYFDCRLFPDPTGGNCLPRARP